MYGKVNNFIMAKGKQEEKKPSLQQQLDAITFKNEQARKIKAMQEGKEKLKDSMSRNKKNIVAQAPRIKGLQTLQTL